jgi:carbon storage regulator
MLVLTRKLGERILVPQFDVEITVVAVQGNTVRVGVTAPNAVAVYREEVWQKLHRPTPGSADAESGQSVQREK